MLENNLLQYATTIWADQLKPITFLSKRDDNGESLVTNDKKLFWFDSISKELYRGGECPASTDGLDVSETAIEFIEFKSGFKQRLTKKTFTASRATCPHIAGREHICDDYWDLFWKNQGHERKILIDSLRLKAIESYITLDKKVIASLCPMPNPKKIKVKLTIVIDEDEVDSIEDTLAGLANKAPEPHNCFAEIKAALGRLVNQKDATGQGYFYDEIAVISAVDFNNGLRLQATGALREDSCRIL